MKSLSAAILAADKDFMVELPSLLARISHSPCRKRDFGQGEDGVPDEAVGTA